MTTVIPAEHPALAGHFPGHPIVPGVVLLDAVQAALEAHIGKPVRVTGFPSVKFTRTIAPGEGFDCRFELKADDHYTFNVVASNGAACVTGSVTVEPARA